MRLFCFFRKLNDDIDEIVVWFVGDCIGESSKVYMNENALNTTIIALNVCYNWRRHYFLLTLLRGSGGVERGNGYIKGESKSKRRLHLRRRFAPVSLRNKIG